MKPRRYAQDTEVSVEKSQLEVKRILDGFGCDSYATHEDAEAWRIVFQSQGRWYRLMVRRPQLTDKEISLTEAGHGRSRAQAQVALERTNRQRWRGLVLRVKAKIEAIAAGAGDTKLEREFLADMVLPDGTTVGEWLSPQLATAYQTSKMPALLGPAFTGRLLPSNEGEKEETPEDKRS